MHKLSYTKGILSGNRVFPAFVDGIGAESDRDFVFSAFGRGKPGCRFQFPGPRKTV
jgi:hypothetical protein